MPENNVKLLFNNNNRKIGWIDGQLTFGCYLFTDFKTYCCGST